MIQITATIVLDLFLRFFTHFLINYQYVKLLTIIIFCVIARRNRRLGQNFYLADTRGTGIVSISTEFKCLVLVWIKNNFFVISITYFILEKIYNIITRFGLHLCKKLRIMAKSHILMCYLLKTNKNNIFYWRWNASFIFWKYFWYTFLENLFWFVNIIKHSLRSVPWTY